MVIDSAINSFKKVFTFRVVVFGTILASIMDELALAFSPIIVRFIMILVVVDIVTKWYSLVVTYEGEFSFKNFLKAIKDGFINSNGFRKGVFGKILVYTLLCIIAAFIGFPEMKEYLYINDEISKIIYSMIVVTELISIFENIRDGNQLRGADILINRVKNEYSKLSKDEKTEVPGKKEKEEE